MVQRHVQLPPNPPHCADNLEKVCRQQQDGCGERRNGQGTETALLYSAVQRVERTRAGRGHPIAKAGRKRAMELQGCPAGLQKILPCCDALALVKSVAAHVRDYASNLNGSYDSTTRSLLLSEPPRLFDLYCRMNFRAKPAHLVQ